MRDGIKVLHKFGVCEERVWPYSEKRVLVKPPAEAFREAETRKISNYERLSTLVQMKNCLASGYGFVLGFKVYSNFESPEVARSGILDMPAASDTSLGGHAVMAVGYDEPSRVLTLRNSWGEAWGMHGYFTMPYDYVTSGLVMDTWTINS